MSNTKDTEFDYQAYMRQEPPDPGEIKCGPHARQERRRTTKSMITIRIDRDVLEQFKQMAPAGQGYQSLINQSLRDWLAAQGIKELVREELREMTEKVVASIGRAASASERIG